MKAAAWTVGGAHAQCHSCRLVVQMSRADADSKLRCPRCGAAIHRRIPDSLTRTMSYLIAAAICYVPANLFPIMTVTSMGYVQTDTILSGAMYLLFHGMWPLALVVFIASVFVPLLKLVVLTGLVISVQMRSQSRTKERAMLYRIVAAIGRWSMVDVYVVTILVALVHLGAVASVEAELGSFFFGTVVVLTILAAESFDPRLIWDQLDRENTT